MRIQALTYTKIVDVDLTIPDVSKMVPVGPDKDNSVLLRTNDDPGNVSQRDNKSGQDQLPYHGQSRVALRPLFDLMIYMKP